MDLLPYLPPLQDSGPAPSLPSLLRVAGMSEPVQSSPKRDPYSILDVCCCAGAASLGYWLAGFDPQGIDIAPQKNYRFPFEQASLLDLDPQWIRDNFDAIHLSPPCQPDSAMSNCRPGLADTYARLIRPARDLAQATDLPYVIENVVGSDLIDPVMLCGFMFGRDLYRHRLFETNWPLEQPDHPAHTIPGSKAGHWRPGTIMSVAGHVAPVAEARRVMEIDWTTRDELVEAIPPYYSHYVGQQLEAFLDVRQEAVA